MVSCERKQSAPPSARRAGGYAMEKIYNRVLAGGAVGIACGIVSIVTGLTVGVLLIVTGGRLLSARKYMEE